MSFSQHHILVSSLIDEIPIHGEPWGTSKRAKWLAAAQSVFDLLYTEQGNKKKTELEPAEPATEYVEASHILSQPQLNVLAALVKMKANEQGWIAEPMRAIARDAGTSASLVPNILDRLERHGVIKIDRRKGDGVNRYLILKKGIAE